MAKRKRLEPARGISPELDTGSVTPARSGLTSMRPPIADVAQDAATSAAFEEVTRELASARTSGRLIQALPLAAIDETYLVRDRITAEIDPDDMAVLVKSLQERGQQTAIEVSDLGDGRFGLISGWRRLRALRDIAGIDTVLAIVRQPEDMPAAYQAMVDENEIRASLSFYERARIVVKARDQGVFKSTKGALTRLFGSVPRAKRSKINSFITVVDTFDGVLAYPVAITEKLGLAMAKAVEGDPGFAPRLTAALQAAPPKDAAAEVAVIAAVLRQGTKPPAPPRPALEKTRISDGLTMTVHPEGRVVLEGAQMTDPAVLTALRRALSAL